MGFTKEPRDSLFRFAGRHARSACQIGSTTGVRWPEASVPRSRAIGQAAGRRKELMAYPHRLYNPSAIPRFGAPVGAACAAARWPVTQAGH